MRLPTALTCLMAGLAGCVSPFESSPPDDWRGRIEEAIAAQVAGADAEAPPLRMTAEASVIEETLAERRGELDDMSPAMGANRVAPVLDVDLTGRDQSEVEVTLDQLVGRAVTGNLGVRASSLQPAINAEDIIQADAIFDAVVFGGADYTNTDTPNVVPVINGFPIGTGATQNDRLRFDTGIRKAFRGGGELTAVTELLHSNNQTPGLSTSPDPANTASVTVGFTQPLLRGFGTAVNTATIRLAENETERSRDQLVVDLLDVVRAVEEAYWDLTTAWYDLEISEWLVRVGIEVRTILDHRRDFDTLPAQYADAVATIEQRRANVIRARRAVRAASDALKQLVNDPAVPVGSEVLLRPSDVLRSESIEFSLRESILTAIQSRPEIHQAMLAIDDTAIRERVAENALLPILDANAQLAWFGLDDDAAGAYGEVADRDYANWVVGLLFEHPLGNRAAEAGLRQARLRRSAAILRYQQAVQAVVVEVKAALRDLLTNYELIEQTRSFRVAQAENLRTLLAEEDLSGLTPEFLNLKFQRQEGLAQARRQETEALAAYRQALAALHRATGAGLVMRRISIESVGDPGDRDVLRP